MLTQQNNRHFIIAGTEKAGTTSLYMWLASHPQVCASRVKETDYFRGEVFAYQDYIKKFFAHCEGECLLMEASPGYLSEADKVAEPLSRVLPKARIIFVLRDPVERLLSTYRFHVGRMNIKESISFDDYVDRCFRFEEGGSPEELEMGRWYLASLAHGRYGDKLEHFYRRFPSEQICVLFFDDLKVDVVNFMRVVCNFLGLDFDYFLTFEFKKENVTFGGRIKWLHRLALMVNNGLEPLMRRHPYVKRGLLDLYKNFNEDKKILPGMSLTTRTKLEAYYLESNQKMLKMITPSNLVSWLNPKGAVDKREMT